MTVLVTILSDCWLVLMLLLSVMIANWWGELAGIRPGRDKSGLGGFAAIYLFFAVRWLGLAILLPSWSWLGAHAVLGALSGYGFGRGVDRVQGDGEVPALLGLLGAWLPVPVLWVEFTAVHGMEPTGGASVLLGLGMLALLTLPYLHRRRDLRRVRPAAVDTPGEGEPPFK